MIEPQTSVSGIRYWAMECDFNSLRMEGVPASFDGFPSLVGVVQPGDRVMLRDGDGNRCEGRVRGLVVDTVCMVVPDWDTWQDGPDA